MRVFLGKCCGNATSKIACGRSPMPDDVAARRTDIQPEWRTQRAGPSSKHSDQPMIAKALGLVVRPMLLARADEYDRIAVYWTK